ncbi:VOC family protein [Sesbania bispinosa]|nr:VOC family protein [Sesbania bispinosa]
MGSIKGIKKRRRSVTNGQDGTASLWHHFSKNLGTTQYPLNYMPFGNRMIIIPDLDQASDTGGEAFGGDFEASDSNNLVEASDSDRTFFTLQLKFKH